MRSMRTLAIVVVLAAVPLSLAFSGGAGGTTTSWQYYDPDFSNYNLDTRLVGGFGYGVGSRGQRFGGFGMAFFATGSQGLAGGVGGLITGQELSIGPITLALNVWAGLGGMGTNLHYSPAGYAIAFGEVNLEVGVAVFPWMQVVGFAGMQGMANLIPGAPFESAVFYTPVTGFRIAWGSF